MASRSRSRSRSRSPERSRDLPHNASPISESDYFLKSAEFRIWLKDEKRKYFDELSGEKARSYFRKFVKAWNKGKLSKSLYAGADPASVAANQTSYKWSFASKQTRNDAAALDAARHEIAAATHGRDAAASASGSGKLQGPTLPSSSDLALARELEAENRDEERKHKRKRDKMEAKDRIEDMVGPKEVGREGMLEKKRAKRDNDRAFREKGEDGLEADETTLMGGGDSFRAAIAKRDANKDRYKQKNAEKAYEMRERASHFKEKEKATMDMFQQLAKQRFG
ncbi:hypothetical protein CCMSSC00406_0009586 [Pleurotus cornucopiae]|uniref:Uncharacterized protein n=1 Tax=Pleurotus cornucopiae TaxID=5321 RepID=A0ACB7IWM1_PLECO|nr:hypothetical protein CCMSSC00406_0009586 [Pleurotus cornucopiae]